MVKCNMDSIWSWMIFLMFHFIFLIRFWMGEYELSCRISMENLDRYELLYSREIRAKKTIACKKGIRVLDVSACSIPECVDLHPDS